MKSFFFFILLLTISLLAYSQHTSYWQQQVDYEIKVKLDDLTKILDGEISIDYKNNSADTLHFIWFHLWANAYKNDRSAFCNQELENGNTDFYFSNGEKKGSIDQLDFKINNLAATFENKEGYEDIIKLKLAKPLLPGAAVTIKTPFHEKIPYNFSRGGYLKNSFQITQWYPKPAVYDQYGWHEMPYLDQGEFYSEFGNYTVSITLPKEYIVAATGMLIDSIVGEKTKTIQFSQNNIHDFAWFADTHFIVEHDTLQLQSKIINLYAYHYSDSANKWSNALQYMKQAAISKSSWIGEYPYNTLSIVESLRDANGGMEYPTIASIEKTFDADELNEVINHEIGHNWFYGILASNERDHPWMDEGINTYYDKRYQSLYQTKYTNFSSNNFFSKRIPDNFDDLLLESIYRSNIDQQIETKSADFSMYNYDLIAYRKTAQWISLLENKIGEKDFDRAMKLYFDRWKYKHPYPEDFKTIMEEVYQNKLSDAFSLLNKKGSLIEESKRKLKISTFFNFSKTNKYNYLFVAPAIGYNKYDQLMLGCLLHNYTLPIHKFQIFAAPIYSMQSKSIHGIGRLSYRETIGSKGEQLVFFVGVASFSNNIFVESSNKNNFLGATKIVPGIKYLFAKRNPRSPLTKYIQWKGMQIQEKTILFSTNTVDYSENISYPIKSTFLNQVEFVIKNDRVLYPYKISIFGEKGPDFMKLNISSNYFLNYVDGGGLNCRLFFGQFIYTTKTNNSLTYETDRYHYNMSGADGYEDYSYSNYFLGRNEFEGISSQQLMIKDGAFKVRTSLLSDKVGKSDKWLTAINLTTTVPNKMNPLFVLPIKIPLKLFADFGTYAEAWDNQHQTERFLYDGGFQLSLFKNSMNIYIPIIFSKSYLDYFKSTIPKNRFIKTISFSIDIQNISLKTFIPQSPF